MKRILVADDNEGVLDSVRIILEGEGFAVRAVTDADEVLPLSLELPDLIILDLLMSGADGREVCKLLKAQEPTAHIPILLMSANSGIAQIASEAGAEGYIGKPFEIDDLVNTCIELMGR